jgi:hypothetical protein
VLIDWLGSQKIDESLIGLMQEAGVVVQRYRPLRWYIARLNNRTHRKLLVVDGSSASPAEWASPTSGSEMLRTPSTGATRTIGSRVRRLPRCRAPYGQLE